MKPKTVNRTDETMNQVTASLKFYVNLRLRTSDVISLGRRQGEMGGMGPTIFLTAALARPRVKYVQQQFSQRPWGRHRGRNGRNGSNNIFNSSAGAAESEIRPTTFFAATLGRHRERNGRNGSNNISHSSAGGRWRNRSSNISYSRGGTAKSA